MKALAIGVKWNINWANMPTLYALVDKFPQPEEGLLYKKRGGIYYAEEDGYVSFFSWGGKPDSGYGGRTFDLQVMGEDGVVRKEALVGPWSSNSCAVNSMGFGPCVEIAWTEDPQVWERGHTFFAGSTTVEWVKKALAELLPSVEMAGYLMGSTDKDVSFEQMQLIIQTPDDPKRESAFFTPTLVGFTPTETKELKKKEGVDQTSSKVGGWGETLR